MHCFIFHFRACIYGMYTAGCMCLQQEHQQQRCEGNSRTVFWLLTLPTVILPSLLSFCNLGQLSTLKECMFICTTISPHICCTHSSHRAHPQTFGYREYCISLADCSDAICYGVNAPVSNCCLEASEKLLWW